jgi:hypothetical protein
MMITGKLDVLTVNPGVYDLLCNETYSEGELPAQPMRHQESHLSSFLFSEVRNQNRLVCSRKSDKPGMDIKPITL